MCKGQAVDKVHTSHKSKTVKTRGTTADTASALQSEKPLAGFADTDLSPQVNAIQVSP